MSQRWPTVCQTAANNYLSAAAAAASNTAQCIGCTIYDSINIITLFLVHPRLFKVSKFTTPTHMQHSIQYQLLSKYVCIGSFHYLSLPKCFDHQFLMNCYCLLEWHVARQFQTLCQPYSRNCPIVDKPKHMRPIVSNEWHDVAFCLTYAHFAFTYQSNKSHNPWE